MKPVIGLTQNYVGPDESRCPSRSGSFYINTAYVEAVTRAGALPVFLPHLDADDAVGKLIDRIDGLLLTGGKDLDPSLFGEEPHPSCERILPARSASDVALCRAALSRQLPILAICLGMQTLNVALGGDLYQDVPSQFGARVAHRQAEENRDGPAHPVEIEEGTLLHAIVGARLLDVNSVHHQAVRRIGRGLVVSGRSPDGLAEAIEHPEHEFCVGVQWHPEDLTDSAPHRALFEMFVQAIERRAR